MADGYDFQIGSMKFRAAISDQYPYVRSTAPFRKEQLDSAPTVGDQSLTGWWVRGQLSFHGGAGTKFYEVLDGAEVLNTFQDSNGVNVKVPGQVTLNYDFVNVANPDPGQADGVTYLPYSYRGATMAGIHYHEFVSDQLKVVYDENEANDFPAAPTTETLTNLTTQREGGICNDGIRSVWILTGSAASTTATVNIECRDIAGGAVVYTHSANLYGLWFAKGRLWAVDVNGDLYVVPKKITGPATGLGTAVANLGNSWLSLTSSPADVYVSNETNQLYRITTEADGSVPTLSAPVVAAELPGGEIISQIRYHLGYIVAATTRGIRVGEVQGDGSVLFGPLLLGGATPFQQLVAFFQAYGIAAYGTSVFVPHWDSTVPGVAGVAVYEIDLSRPGEQPGDFPWCKYATTNPTSAFGQGVVEMSRGFVIWDGDLLKATGTSLLSSGWIRTGYHRFGTLDPKRFQSISVRCGGDGGSINVYRVDADGTETLLGNVTPTEAEKEFSVGLTAAQERIAFKFELTRDGVDATAGPSLLGYQLKALPAPARQRILKWPLSIQDLNKLRQGTGIGRNGKAYADIKELEALENSQAIVSFEDLRTGETGTAYIDSVELQTDTPSTATTNGFGGVAYVTLRVLD